MVNGDHPSLTNVVPNVFGGSGLREEVARLWAKGLEVDDDTKPLSEDETPTPAKQEGMQ